MFSITTTDQAELRFAWALAVFDTNDWLRMVANPDADFGAGYSRMLAAAETILLGEPIHDVGRIIAATEAALCQIEFCWSDNVDDAGFHVLEGFLNRSAPVDELSELWAMAAATA